MEYVGDKELLNLISTFQKIVTEIEDDDKQNLYEYIQNILNHEDPNQKLMELLAIGYTVKNLMYLKNDP